MKKERTALAGGILGSALMVLAGVLLLVKPDLGSAAVAAVIGWGVILISSAGALAGILSRTAWGFSGLALSALGLCAGIYLVRHPLSLASILGFVLGAYLAFQGISGLVEALKLKRSGLGCRANLVLAAVLLAFGVVLIAFPLSASQLVMTLCGIALVGCGVSNLVIRWRSEKQLRGVKEKPRIIDAE